MAAVKAEILALRFGSVLDRECVDDVGVSGGDGRRQKYTLGDSCKASHGKEGLYQHHVVLRSVIIGILRVLLL